MEFSQATRYIFPFYKFFAITPFDISGPPGQRQIQKNRKCFILGNILTGLSLCFVLKELVICSMNIFILEDVVVLIALTAYFVMLLSAIITSLAYHKKFIQYYQEFTQISDRHPNCNKYFINIFYLFIFELVYYLVNITITLTRANINSIYDSSLLVEFAYILIEFYNFIFFSHFHLILISTICVLKALNENLLNSQIHILDSFNKMFNLLEKIISISEINLLSVIFLQFFWILASIFSFLLSILYSDRIQIITNFCFVVNIFNYFVEYFVVLCFLIEQLKQEVRVIAKLFSILVGFGRPRSRTRVPNLIPDQFT